MMILGPTIFNMVTNMQEAEASSEARFAEHKILGGPIVHEAVGEGKSEFTISGVIYPERIGVDGGISKLKLAKSALIPIPLMRGDFTPMGWVIIRAISSKEIRINSRGVGKKITFSAKLEFTGKPSGAALTQSILELIS